MIGCKLSTFDLHVVLEELCGVERPRLQVRSGPDSGGAVLGGEVIEHYDGLAAKIALVNPECYFHPIIDELMNDYTCMFKKRGNPELGTDLMIPGQFSGCIVRVV